MCLLRSVLVSYLQVTTATRHLVVSRINLDLHFAEAVFERPTFQDDSPFTTFSANCMTFIFLISQKVVDIWKHPMLAGRGLGGRLGGSQRRFRL